MCLWNGREKRPKNIKIDIWKRSYVYETDVERAIALCASRTQHAREHEKFFDLRKQVRLLHGRKHRMSRVPCIFKSCHTRGPHHHSHKNESCHMCTFTGHSSYMYRSLFICAYIHIYSYVSFDMPREASRCATAHIVASADRVFPAPTALASANPNLPSFMPVTWLFHTWDMTHSYMCGMTHPYQWHVTTMGERLVRVMFGIRTCSYLYLWHDLFLCVSVTCHYYGWKTRSSHVWHPNLLVSVSVTRLISMCGMTHSCMWHPTFQSRWPVTWLDSFIRVFCDSFTCHDSFICVTCFVSMWVTARSSVWNS